MGETDSCRCAHQRQHHYPGSCCFAIDQIGPWQERCGCRCFEDRKAADSHQAGDMRGAVEREG